LRAYAGQVDAAIEAGWLHVVTPSRTLVGELIKFSGLDQGEAESIVVASQLDHPGMRLLLDEGESFCLDPTKSETSTKIPCGLPRTASS